MADYGHEVRLGIFPSPDARAANQAVMLAEVADTSGIDLVSIQDHPYNASHLDTWTLLTWIAARTSQVRVSPNVASLPLRPPVVLARSAATLDLLSGGRVDLGLGTGAFWDAIAAAGGPRRTPGEAVEALEEAIEVIRQVWRGTGSVRVDGEHYAVHGLRSGPAPGSDIPIWIGAYKPRMLRVTGRLAQGWLPSMAYLPPEQLAEANARIDEAATKAGRDPASVVRLYNIGGRFGSGSGMLQGTPGQWAEQLAELVTEHGMSTFILATDDPDEVRRFGTEVGPELRDLVDREREHPRAGADAAGSAPVEVGAESATAMTGTARVAQAEAARLAPTDGASATASAVPLEVGLRITADDGVRRSEERPWDETTRPTVPTPQGAPMAYTPQQLARPQHLIDIHDHLRQELSRVLEVIEQVREGHLQVGQARSVINTMTMRQNNWTLGGFCAAYCRIVTGHHTLEDRSVFPHLASAEPEVAPVIERLEEEHEIIADVLDRLDRALVAMVDNDGYGAAGRDALDELAAAVALLSDVLLSHLAYEERELAGPLARHGFY